MASVIFWKVPTAAGGGAFPPKGNSGPLFVTGEVRDLEEVSWCMFHWVCRAWFAAENC